MATEEEIVSKYARMHDDLTRQYYADPVIFPGGKVAFDAAHGAIWANMHQELIDAGYIDPPGPTLEERVKALEDKIG